MMWWSCCSTSRVSRTTFFLPFYKVNRKCKGSLLLLLLGGRRRGCSCTAIGDLRITPLGGLALAVTVRFALPGGLDGVRQPLLCPLLCLGLGSGGIHRLGNLEVLVDKLPVLCTEMCIELQFAPTMLSS